MECPSCMSYDTVEKTEEGDTYFECLKCGYTVENNVKTREGKI